HLGAVARRDLRERSTQQRRGDPAPTPGLDHAQHAHELLVLVWERDEMSTTPPPAASARHTSEGVPVVGVKAVVGVNEDEQIRATMVAMATRVQVVIDCADPERLARFWALALGYREQPPPEGFDSWEDALRAWNVPEDQWNSRSAVIDPDGVGP